MAPCAGLAGGFSAALTGVVSPEATGFPVMLLCLTSVVVGGARHPIGAVLGAAVAVCLPELFRGLQGSWLLAYAAATLAVVLWAPEGLAGLFTGARPRLPPMPADARARMPAHAVWCSTASASASAASRRCAMSPSRSIAARSSG